MLDVTFDTLIDVVKLVPFLFLTYFAMEYIEHRMRSKTQQTIAKAGKLGPLFGGALGILPQCGFSAAASNLYAGRVISLGTLIAIYLSTSDEMLPIFISEGVDLIFIVKVLSLKLVIGMVSGFIIDLFYQKHKGQEIDIAKMCEHDHCHCEKSILTSALKHTLQITFFLLIITFVLNSIIYLIGENSLQSVILNRPMLAPILAGVVGLIPNCASSVIITQLYLNGMIGFGAMMSGLLVGAGVGLLVLFRANHNFKENVKIVIVLYMIGIVCGLIMEGIGISF